MQREERRKKEIAKQTYFFDAYTRTLAVRQARYFNDGIIGTINAIDAPKVQLVQAGAISSER